MTAGCGEIKDMKTVTICGSMKFAQNMKEIAFELESRNGYNVLQCTYNERNMKITDEMSENLTKSHLRKIDMSDMIYVVDVDGYIGEAVEQEIEYARKHHKEIVYYGEGTGRK